MREKFELLKHLDAVQKENKNYKSQIKEMLEERTLLIRRLDSVTQEIMINTRSKRKEAAKLEQALLSADKFKNDFEKMSKDNVVLERKIRALEVNYGKLSEQLKLYEKMEGSSEEAEAERPGRKSEQREVRILTFDAGISI